MKQIPESPFNGAEERILTQRGMPILSTLIIQRGQQVQQLKIRLKNSL